MIIFPAIDLINGECVRLSQGNFAEKTFYSKDPIAVAEAFQGQGTTWLHLVDLDGARAGKVVHSEIIRKIVKLGINLEVGGGIRTIETAKSLLDSGVKRIVAGSALIKSPKFRREFFAFGDCSVAGLDVKDRKPAIHGWEDTEDTDIIELLRRFESEGCKRYILTDISTDGMLCGPNISLLKECIAKTAMKVVHSGGIGSLCHIQSLQELGSNKLEGIILGKALYERSVNLREVIHLFGN